MDVFGPLLLANRHKCYRLAIICRISRAVKIEVMDIYIFLHKSPKRQSMMENESELSRQLKF